MSAVFEYKRTRSGGVLGLRSIGNTVGGVKPIRQDWEGIAVDDVVVWKTSLLGGKTILVGGSTYGNGYQKAVRVNDPVEGRVWWINTEDLESQVNVTEEPFAVTYQETVGTVFVASYDYPGEIDGEESYDAIRIHLADGTNFVTYFVPA
jgi:hypothetical protein